MVRNWQKESEQLFSVYLFSTVWHVKQWFLTLLTPQTLIPKFIGLDSLRLRNLHKRIMLIYCCSSYMFLSMKRLEIS